MASLIRCNATAAETREAFGRSRGLLQPYMIASRRQGRLTQRCNKVAQTHCALLPRAPAPTHHTESLKPPPRSLHALWIACNQARKIVRERSAGGTHTEQQYLHNVAEGDAEAFDAKWAEDAFLLGLTAGREPLAVTKQEGLYEGGVQQVMIRERQKAQLDRGMLRSAMGASQALDFSAVPMSFGKNFDSSAIKEAMGMEPPPKRTEQSVAISVDRVNRMRMKSRNHSYN